MSYQDCQRLLRDLQKDPGLTAEIDALKDGELVRWAGARGYELSQEEAQALLESRRELSDDDLDQVAGGEDAWGSGTGGTGGTSGTGGTGGGTTTP